MQEFVEKDLPKEHVDQGVHKLESTPIYFEQESRVEEKSHTNYLKNLVKAESYNLEIKSCCSK